MRFRASKFWITIFALVGMALPAAKYMSLDKMWNVA
jgi:hypothetical protein